MASSTSATPVTTNGEVRMREKKTAPKLNGNSTADHDKISTNTKDGSTHNVVPSNSQTLTLEQSFFFGLTIEDALKSSENFLELMYNACKYNHLELVKRCIEEKKVNINEPFNNDYSLCIAR